MSSILNNLGVDESDLEWYHLSACSGIDTNLFFDKYESDINIAKNIDEMCMMCPVAKSCYGYGVKNSEYGVWGGIYLSAGSIDRARNVHKDAEMWKRVKKKSVH